MKVVLDIPQEFESDFEERDYLKGTQFEDSMLRIKADIKSALDKNDFGAAGNYELETVEMLIEAFRNAKIN